MSISRIFWPTTQEVAETVERTRTREAFKTKYADVFKGDEKWQGAETTDQQTYDWPATSTHAQNPPYFQGITMDTKDREYRRAKVLALLGDMITTDHTQPQGRQGHHPRGPISDRASGARAGLNSAAPAVATTRS